MKRLDFNVEQISNVLSADILSKNPADVSLLSSSRPTLAQMAERMPLPSTGGLCFDLIKDIYNREILDVSTVRNTRPQLKLVETSGSLTNHGFEDVFSPPPSHCGYSTSHTLKSAIGCVGNGLHCGERITVRIRPAPMGMGIVFRRVDLGVDILARFDHVADTRLCTVIASPSRADARVGGVEHLMAALAALEVSSAVIEVNGPELPVLDGSADPWLFLLDCAGLEPHAARIPAVEVLQPVRVTEGDAFTELRPNPAGQGLHLALSVAFSAPAIGRQALSLQLDQASFRAELSAARTFSLRAEIEAMQRAGLARGSNLDNTLVVDGDTVLNPSGLRRPDEFVRHKLLDAVGDLALVGAPLCAHFVGHRSDHALNNKLLREFFSDNRNWRWGEVKQSENRSGKVSGVFAA